MKIRPFKNEERKRNLFFLLSVAIKLVGSWFFNKEGKKKGGKKSVLVQEWLKTPRRISNTTEKKIDAGNRNFIKRDGNLEAGNL